MRRAEGPSGEMLAGGYQRAIALGAWCIEGDSASRDLVAEVREEDPFWSEHRPMDLVLHLTGTVSWTWKNIAFKRVGKEVRAKVDRRPEVGARVARQ